MIDKGSSLQLLGEAAGVGAEGSGGQDLPVPLHSVPHVYLGLAERDDGYSATVGDEIRLRAVSGSFRGNMKWIISQWPCLLCAIGLQDTGGSQTQMQINRRHLRCRMEALLLSNDSPTGRAIQSEQFGWSVLPVQVLMSLKVWVRSLSQFLACLLPGIYFSFLFL